MRRRLTPEERALWRRAMRDAAPMRRRPETPPAEEAPVVRVKSGSSSFKPSKSIAAQKSAPLTGRVHDPFQAGDPRLDRHARRGRMPIDAVIDLHGHTQTTARAALLSFLAAAKAEGKRCVLVITGKGSTAGRPGRGVLRARFGDWLKEDAFRDLVVRASPAHPRHGGSGAFYAFLKSDRNNKMR